MVISGTSVITLAAGLALFPASTRGFKAGEFMRTAISQWCMSPLIFGVAFMLDGGDLQQNRKNKSRGSTSGLHLPSR